MEPVIRNVDDFESADRRALERVIGQPLQDSDRVMIHVLAPANADQPSDGAESPTLPDWCDVYAGLTDAEIADVERIVLERARLGRDAG